MTAVVQALAGLTCEQVAAGVCGAALRTAHRELAQVIAAAETERRLPAYLLPSLRRIELMLRADTIGEIADRLWEGGRHG